MATMERKKMCAGCDGIIPFDAIICPYCNAHQSSASMDHSSYQASLYKNQPMNDASASLYPPAYSPKVVAQPMGATPADTTKKFLKNSSEEKKNMSAPSIPFAENPAQPAEAASQQKNALWATLSICLGANLLTVGFLQLLFSSNGVLNIQMNSSYWYLLCLAAAPLFYLGLRSAKNLKS